MRKINVLLLSVGAITGTFRHLMDIIENIDKNKFTVSVTYKPELKRWGEEEIHELTQTDVRIFPIRGKNLYDFLGILDLIRILNREPMDVIHCFDSLGIIVRIIGKLFKCKIIHHLGNTPDQTVTKLSKAYVASFITSFFLDAATFASIGVKKNCLQHRFIYWKRLRKAIVYQCVDTKGIESYDKTPVIKKYAIPSYQHILTNIGYFNKQKGQIYLLEVLREVLQRYKNTCLIIVGWGPLERELKMTARKLEINHSVVFTGKLHHEEVFKVLSLTDIFVLSSLWEGFGIVMAEAMALEVPVIATDTDGSREVVDNGKTGLLVPPQNTEAMVSAILSLLDNPEERTKMGRMGRLRVEKRFSPAQFIRKHEDLYRELLPSST